jgi:hypothetical protein
MHSPFRQLGFLQAPSVVCRGPSEAINDDYLLTILYRRSLDGCLVAQKVLGVNGDANAFSHFLPLFKGVAQVLSLGQDAEVSYRIIRKHRPSTRCLEPNMRHAGMTSATSDARAGFI